MTQKKIFQIEINIDGQTERYQEEEVPTSDAQPKDTVSNSYESVSSGTHCYSLQELAYTRSGDKGNNVNIGKCAN